MKKDKSKKSGNKAEVQELAKTYSPQEFEDQIYSFWEKNRCFEASDQDDRDSFSIMIPPPNVTGVLHMGHALTVTIQDILIRWKRMSGANTLWLPGTDHAGIATQTQVERAIAKEGKGKSGKPLTRYDLGREEFLRRTWKWKDEHHGKITGQLKRLGSSLDWKRERFTMDEGLSRAVREVFVQLYQEGLIYRGERIINWCVRCQTALSDLEVIPTEQSGAFWHIRYDIVEDDGEILKDSNGDPVSVVVATTRPETLLGDTAIAVHPEDERYQNIIGKKAKLPLLGRLIPVIADEYVDREFGSGALKVTPAHDFNDYDLGVKHDLPVVSVIGRDGKVSAAGGPYVGLNFKEARNRVTHDLKEKGFLVRTEPHVHKVGHCQRCDEVAEPMISKQWFVKIAPLAQPAIEAVENGKIVFYPKSWEKTYFEWMYNIRDWCISRQLWWGHRIPAWYCENCHETTVAKTDPDQCEHCGSKANSLKQDEDVLDTWFSSGLWPFSTLGWPEKTKALQKFYPGAVLETGFDIIFFWVARMIMMGIHFMGEVPFKRVYLHAMVRDEKGEKMSKSKGNVIDPLQIIDQCGADPLRFTLAIMAGQGRDIKLSTDRVEGYRAFCNKLWNATKYFHFQIQNFPDLLSEPSEGFQSWIESRRSKMNPVNRWILSELQHLIDSVNQNLEEFHINQAAQSLYNFTWREFCDWYIEFSKLSFKDGGKSKDSEETLAVLSWTLEQLLRLLHPFIPHVTEQLWRSLPWKKASNNVSRQEDGLPEIYTLMLLEFPKSNSSWIAPGAEKTVGYLKSVVEALRNFRGENRIAPKVEFPVQYYCSESDSTTDRFIEDYSREISALTRVSEFQRVQEISSSDSRSTVAVIPLSSPPVEFRIDLSGIVDFDEELKRLNKEISRLNNDLEGVRKKLANPSFVERAPKEVVEKDRAREMELESKLKELKSSLDRIDQQSK